MFSPMDATRTDWDYLIQVCRTAMDAGATIINVPDTVSDHAGRDETPHREDRKRG